MLTKVKHIKIHRKILALTKGEEAACIGANIHHIRKILAEIFFELMCWEEFFFITDKICADKWNFFQIASIPSLINSFFFYKGYLFEQEFQSMYPRYLAVG